MRDFELSRDQILLENDLAVAFFDHSPETMGHILVVPRRPARGYFDLEEEDVGAIWSLVDDAMVYQQRHYAPLGWNVGFNDGPIAGQTVGRFHVHVIPRYEGDGVGSQGVRRLLRRVAPSAA